MLDVVFNDIDSHFATGDKAKGRDIVAALHILKHIGDHPATDSELSTLRRFPGFGCVALSIFPDPQTGAYKDEFWQHAGDDVARLLTPEEYASAKRSVFNAFYTSPIVMRSIFAALEGMGVPADAHILEPGCGIGRFIEHAPSSARFTGIEMDTVSGRIARLIHPQHDIRIENFRDSVLPPMDAVIGNVPFADITLDHQGHRFSLHDYFFAKSVDALRPGGVLGLVTSRYSLDKQNGAARDYLADRVDFLGAYRLPDEAFKEQGTRVVTDVVFLRKRGPGEPENHAGDWRGVTEIDVDGQVATVNRWYVERPDMVLGEMSLGRGMYGQDTLKVRQEEDFTTRLWEAINSLPEGIFSAHNVSQTADEPAPVSAPAGLGEGSFFVAGGALMQIECGAALPVCHGTRELRSDEGTMGRRLAALIELRDHARAVLRSQNEGWGDRESPRRDLNRAYDRFAGQFGPINKTTFSKNAQGNEIRRMPNLARFREDPDAFLVMSLEEYDDATGRADKAPIMRQDVVGPTVAVTSVETAEAGLLVSLNERGCVDLDHIASLYPASRDAIIAELGDLVFEDPADGYVTRDEYLSGNVRTKLAAAQTAGVSRNIAALEAVQPEDLLPGDIDANLGAPWIPVDVIQSFVGELMGVEPHGIAIGHLPKDAVWTVEANQDAKTSVANTDEHGTKRLTGLELLEMAMNLRTPTVYDEFRDPDGGTKRVVNQVETIAAREKQKRIKQRFSGWVFGDPDRAERLVRIYNDGFNNLRVRQFDGAHLTFPGMNETFKLREHQTAAVWRIMSSGNTLLAHCVGGGKTSIMASAAMKLKQVGLVRKSLICVPNHMLEQFGREFLHVYPNARVLIAGKEDLARDRRKLLTAKIATGEWDAIIVTHSSFERIGMSREFQRRFFAAEIAEYEELLVDAKRNEDKGTRAHRNVIKLIEKRKMAYEDKLKELSAEEKKDSGLVFDDLGVDQIFIDESVAHKNLAVASKMDRVAGIQTEGSQRAFDLFMKTRFLDEQKPGHGVAFATGTPISNSMVEMYTCMRYLAPALLEQRGIAHFDAWAAAFGEVVDTMEISPDGASLRPNARFSKFVNLPELQQIFRSFADVQTADMLKLPVPALRGGKADVVSCPMSFAQSSIQTDLVKRYERVRGGGVDPRDDNALKITTDGRKLALDARLNDGETDAWEQSKLYAMTDKAMEIWNRTAGRRGTQMIFCDIGVNPTAWGFCVYDEIKSLLGVRGVPPEQIADIGDANTDAKKAEMFKKMRAGSIRFMIGSTAKMGTGTNVQKLLVAMHHLDAPWKPAEIEQRDGRILRQGNSWPEVEIYRYVTEGSFDAFMWQTLQTKARFIAQVMKGDIGVRRASDIGGQELSFAEVKAIASGNPAVLTLAEIDADIQRMTLLKRSHADEQYRARQAVKFLPDEIARLIQRADDMEADHAGAGDAGHAGVTLGTRVYPDRDKAAEAMNIVLKSHLAELGDKPREWDIGAYRGMRLSLAAEKGAFPELVVTGRTTQAIEFKAIAAGALLNRIDSLIDQMPFKAKTEREKARMKAAQLEGYGARIGLGFDQEDRLQRLQEIRHELETLLSGTEGRDRIDVLVEDYAVMKNDVPAPVTHAPQPELPVVEDLAPVVRVPVVVEKPVEALQVPPRPVAPPTKAPAKPLTDAWHDLFEQSKPKPLIQRPAPRRTVERPVQLSLF